MKVSVKYDSRWEALEWAKKHCPSYITNDVSKASDRSEYAIEYVIDYYFGDEKDALMFMLKWGTE